MDLRVLAAMFGVSLGQNHWVHDTELFGEAEIVFGIGTVFAGEPQQASQLASVFRQFDAREAGREHARRFRIGRRPAVTQHLKVKPIAATVN